MDYTKYHIVHSLSRAKFIAQCDRVLAAGGLAAGGIAVARKENVFAYTQAFLVPSTFEDDAESETTPSTKSHVSRRYNIVNKYGQFNNYLSFRVLMHTVQWTDKDVDALIELGVGESYRFNEKLEVQRIV